MRNRVVMLLTALWASTALCQDFDLYVSDAGNFDQPPWQILKFDRNGGNPEVFIASQLAWPQDILFLESQGVVLISNLNSGRITRHDAATGAYLDDFATGLAGPTRMKIGADGLIYVLQWQGNGRVLRFEQDGDPLGAFTAVGVAQSIGLDWDAQGRLYVSSYNGALVRRFDVDGSDLGVFINSNLAGPTNIWFDGNGDLLVSDYSGGAIKRFSPNGSYLGVFIGGLGQPEGIDRLPDGNLLIGNGRTGTVKMYQPDGAFIEDLVAAGAGGLIRPNAVVVRQTEAASVISPGLNDAWYNPETDGQGFFINVFPALERVFVGWFTYETGNRPGPVPTAHLGEPYHRWLTAVGGWQGNRATLDITNSSGGRFDDPAPVSNSAPGNYGTMEIEFHDCATATLTYELTAIGESGQIPIRRVVPDNVALCEALQ